EPLGRHPVERGVPRRPHGRAGGDDPSLQPFVQPVDFRSDVMPDEVAVDGQFAETSDGESHYGPTFSGTENLAKKSFWNGFTRSSTSRITSPVNVWSVPRRVILYSHVQLKLRSPDGWGLPVAMSRRSAHSSLKSWPLGCHLSTSPTRIWSVAPGSPSHTRSPRLSGRSLW